MSYSPPSPIQKLKNKILTQVDLVEKQIFNPEGGEFCKRIKLRHKTFWSHPNAEEVRNTVMYASDPIEKWKDVEHWQRKLSNKFNSREFAKMFGCRVPDLYWKGRDVDSIDFDELPPQYVIRPTIGHSAILVFLMDEGVNLFSKKKYSHDELRIELFKAIFKNPWQEFLIEEFVRNENGDYVIPDDFKIFSFNGEIACIEIINRLSPKTGFSSFYDENWNLLKTIKVSYPKASFQPPPKCLKEMIESAKKLSKAYEIFVRIDFYATDKGLVFGEFTPTPSLGDNYTLYGEKTFIKYWDTYCKGMI